MMQTGYAISSQIYERIRKDSMVVNFYAATQVTPTHFDNFNNGLLLASDEQKIRRDAKSTLLASVFIPFGINLRLSESKAIWDQLGVFIKGSVGLETQVVAGHKTHFDPYMGMSMGLKFSIK